MSRGPRRARPDRPSPNRKPRASRAGTSTRKTSSGPPVDGLRPARATVVVLLAVALVSVAGCRTPESSKEAEPHGESQAATVETLDYRFSPRTIELERGKAATITVRNEGQVSHTFSSDDAPIDVVVKPREHRDVTFTPAGQVSFFCRFHQADGMKGVLCLRGEECSVPLFP